MRSHWVSQNRTGNDEITGGYKWFTQADKDECILTNWWFNINFSNALWGLR